MKLPAFYPIMDAGLLAKAGISAAAMARELARAGARIAQFRHKGPYNREVFSQAEEAGRILSDAGMLYVINDRADVALMLGADAVHVGQDDLPPVKVRAIVGDSMAIGFSTHNERQLAGGDREPVDYLAIGPIFGTVSKANPDPTVGLEKLARLRPLTSKPLVAIGGITRDNARQVFSAGADSVAVISDLIAGNLAHRIAQWIDVTAAR